MQHDSPILNLIAALAFTTLSATASAQTAVILKATCQGVGTSPQEPVGDRAGHAISEAQYSCRNEGGGQDGSIGTGMTIWEWDKGNAVSLSGNGVVRKPGTMAVYEITEGKNSLTMTDGKVTGFSGTAKGVYKAATGSMTALSGKSFHSTFHSIPGGQFVIETTID